MDEPRYATIRRAPRPADHFTIISNACIRDRALKPADLGVLVRLLSHQDGRGVSAATVMAENSIGRDAALSSLSRLETRGYLVRSQERREDGTLGGGIYWVSDDPASLALLIKEQAEDQNEIIPDETSQNPSSQPQSDLPTPAQPSTANPALRRTTTRRSKDPLPLPLPLSPGNGNGTGNGSSSRPQDQKPPAPRRPPGLPSPASRASAGTRLLRQVALAHGLKLIGRPLRDQAVVVDALLAEGVEADLILRALDSEYVDAAGQPVRSPAAVIAHRLGELAPNVGQLPGPSGPMPQRPDDARPWLLPPRSASGAPPPGLPPWCGQCDERTRQIEKENDDGWADPARCRTCNPNHPDPPF